MDDVEFERLKRDFWQHLDREMEIQTRVDKMNGAQKVKLNSMMFKHPYGQSIIEKAKAEFGIKGELTRSKITVRELRGMIKAVLEGSTIPEELKDKSQLILGFLDKVIEAEELE